MSARKSSSEQFIEKLPEKYDTPLMRYFEDNGTELSIGQWQKLSIARAFYSDSDILILDEPLSGVDVEGMTILMDMLDELRRKLDLSILMTTHDFSMLQRYCDRVVLIQHKVLKKGTPMEVLESDEFAEVFHMGGGL